METTINFIIMLIINLFDAYIIYKFMTIFFGKYNCEKNLLIIMCSFRWLIGTIINEFLPYPIITVIFWFVSTFFISLCYKSNFTKKLLITFVVYIINFISELILALIIQITKFNIFEKAEYGTIITYIMIKIIYWTTTLILQHLKGVKLNVKLPKIFVAAIIIVPASSVIIALIIFSQSNFDRQLTLISLICIMASTFITIYLYDSYSKILENHAQGELAKREKVYYQKQSELLQKNQEELRQFRHDIHNRIITMQQMLEDKQYNNALEYTDQITQRLEHAVSYSVSGNIAIDSIINYKLTQAANKGIEVYADISIPDNLSVHDDDLVVILGNLLDNAIEANDKLSDHKYINLTMKYITGCLTIRTKNSYDSIIYDNNGKIQSRKNDNIMHGIGLRSVQSCVDNYKGSLSIHYDEKEFEVFIMLYASKPTT